MAMISPEGGEEMATMFTGQRLSQETSHAVPQAADELEQEWVIGSQNEFRARLPLTVAEDFLATDRQRSHIGRAAMNRILAEDPSNRQLSFDLLRDRVIELTGLNDASASLAIFGRSKELDNI